MMYLDVESILAYNHDYVIGKGEIIPWHHGGDLRRFAQITKGHALLMGAKTFLGIAENYFKVGKTVLPNRKIFILGSPRNSLYNKETVDEALRSEIVEALAIMDRLVDSQNLYGLYIHAKPEDNILTALSFLKEDQKLFIAGGSKVYDLYLHLSSKVYASIVDAKVNRSHDIVKLKDSTIKNLKELYEIDDEETLVEMDKALEAIYLTLVPKK